ncbi:DUF2590 family protein [Aeromonas veronii]|uniref:DUF2590 family protein n=1 Tax=Aeromonas veronii TaxID=654 RepID=A0A3A9INU1_AERVE|nr:DUF2590 family protein [Aeromonas veronii]RKJ83773.1 DUF2590 family protein [Aeromonas veronii]RKJ84401.1 DUF2590 family protein [Aeromonas veronii]RKJ89958.1 DUF2590 family protein [Aeromonas veronii]RKJ90103.1 DUF2590 family protein [Aeromonas veronii]RKJ92187.1 DUF2590 family protein [Aeromonas veronii]
MSEPKYIDILVMDGAWQLDAGGQPRYTQDRHSIGQDIKHRIMESGLARKLIGERSPTLRADVMTEIELLVENDVRLVPGTILIREEAAGRVQVVASTYEFGHLEVTL